MTCSSVYSVQSTESPLKLLWSLRGTVHTLRVLLSSGADGSLRHAADDAAHVPRVRNYTIKRSNICWRPQITDFTSKCHVHLHNFAGK